LVAASIATVVFVYIGLNVDDYFDAYGMAKTLSAAEGAVVLHPKSQKKVREEKQFHPVR
jgi:hypothetical protein